MKRVAKIIGIIFGLILLVYVGVFFAIKFGWTNTEGEVDPNSDAYNIISKQVDAVKRKVLDVNAQNNSDEDKLQNKTLCQIYVISLVSKQNAETIKEYYIPGETQTITDKMIFAVNLRLKDDQSFQENFGKCDSDNNFVENSIKEMNNSNWSGSTDPNIFEWTNSEEWGVIKEAVIKDKSQMIQASNDADFSSRLLLSTCIVEQLRLYFTQREYYEQFFKPYKILGNANTMAWGVMSIKEDTAIQIENNLKDSGSDYYLGKKYENLLDFKTEDPKQERFLRLTDAHDHYYSYLYGSLYLKELEAQWQKAGFDISDRPEILATLFNLGFGHSKPKADPAVGGSVIEINGVDYTFGSLAFEFYYSGQLQNDFKF
jgi:hypothetical protein